MKLRCKKAGEDVRAVFDKNMEFACKYCTGIIEVKEIGGSRFVFLDIKSYHTLPRKELTGFNCPATTPNPEKSDLVEVIEE